jgi:hypothetical protein
MLDDSSVLVLEDHSLITTLQMISISVTTWLRDTLVVLLVWQEVQHLRETMQQVIQLLIMVEILTSVVLSEIYLNTTTSHILLLITSQLAATQTSLASMAQTLTISEVSSGSLLKNQLI